MDVELTRTSAYEHRNFPCYFNKIKEPKALNLCGVLK